MLKKFLIESVIPGIGESSKVELGQMAEKINETVDHLNGRIQWVESFITRDRIFTLFIAENENIIRELGNQSDLSIESIEELKCNIDPADAVQADLPYDSRTSTTSNFVT